MSIKYSFANYIGVRNKLRRGIVKALIIANIEGITGIHNFLREPVKSSQLYTQEIEVYIQGLFILQRRIVQLYRANRVEESPAE